MGLRVFILFHLFIYLLFYLIAGNTFLIVSNVRINFEAFKIWKNYWIRVDIYKIKLGELWKDLLNIFVDI